MLKLQNYIFILLHAITSLTFAQASPPVPEHIHVHLDKPFYTTGETIWYKVYFLNEDTSAIQSSIIYFDVVNASGEIMVHQKLQRKGSYAHGNINIPFTWSEGYYLLRCYTLWNLNFGKEAIFTQSVPIYNEWNEASTTSSGNETALIQMPANREEQDLKIILRTDKASYHKGENIEVSIQVTDAENQPVKASLSLAVLDTDLLPFEESEATAVLPHMPSNSSDSNALRFQPEKGLQLKVSILSPDDSLPVSCQFISVYHVEDQTFFNTAVSAGDLAITFQDIDRPKTIQIHNHNPFQQAVPLVKTQDILRLLPSYELSEQLPPRTPAIVRYLQLSKLRHKLNELFYAAPVQHNTSMPSIITRFTPDKTYWTKDYQLIRNVEEFIKNVFTKVRVSSQSGQKTVRLFNPIPQQFLEDSPWYMVNGYLTDQEEQVLAMPLENIERVDVFFYRNTIIEQFPPMMMRNGIIAIYTKDRHVPVDLISERNTFIWQGFHQPQPFSVPDTSDVGVPDFRPVVFWEPNLETSQNGEATLTFPSSKAISKCIIYTEGVSTKGEYGRAYTTYQVQFSPN